MKNKDLITPEELKMLTNMRIRRINFGELFAKLYAPAAVKVLAEIMSDPEPPPSSEIRRRAANDILSRAEGRPKLSITLNDETEEQSREKILEEINTIRQLAEQMENRMIRISAGDEIVDVKYSEQEQYE